MAKSALDADRFEFLAIWLKEAGHTHHSIGFEQKQRVGGIIQVNFTGLNRRRDVLRHCFHVEEAIDELPATFRIVVVMPDVEEVGTEETASLLGIRQETVKTRLHRAARRMLRESLGEQVASALKDVFPFNKPRCNALVQKLLDRLAYRPRYC